MRIVAVGYFGEGNVGDDLLLSRLIEETAVALPDAEVLATWGEQSPWQPPVPTIERGIDAVGDALADADAVIIGPGGVLHNAAGFGRKLRDRGVAYYDEVTERSIAHGVPVAAVGVGLGPLAGSTALSVTHRLLGRCTSVTVRDPMSAVLTGRSDAEVVPDLARTDAAPSTAPVAGRLAVGIRYWGDPNTHHALVDTVASAIDAAASDGSVTEVLGVPLSVSPIPALDDRRATQDLLDALDAPVDRSVASITSPDDVGAALASSTGAIAMRLHGAILAAANRTPCVALAYDPKVAAATEGLAVDTLPMHAGSRDVASAIERAMTSGWTAPVTQDHAVVRAQLAGLEHAASAARPPRSPSRPVRAIEGLRIAVGR